MNQRSFRWTALVLACLLLGACRDKHEPVKPIVTQLAAAFVG